MTIIDDSEKDFCELLDEYQDQEGMHHFEGSSGLDNLNKLCGALGYSEDGFKYGSKLEQFLSDNPGACEAIVQWIGNEGNNFREELISNLKEPEEAEPAEQTYYVYGSGMIGCLYDYGPNFCENKEDAIGSFVQLFEDSIGPEEVAEMIADLKEYWRHSFRNPNEAGAHYCEISEEFGVMPVDSDD